MGLASLALVVVAAVLHATWNLLAKRAAPVGPVFVAAYNVVAVAAFAPWVLSILIGGSIAWTATAVGLVLASGLIHLAYSLCLQRGYQVADLSVVYPVARGAGPMLSTVGAILVLGERPDGRAVTGLLLVVCGIGLIATQGDFRAFRRPGGQAGVRWGVATGALIAAYTVVDAAAVKRAGVTPVVLDGLSNLMRFILLLPLVAADPRRAAGAMRGFWWTAAAVGLLSPLAYILVLQALRSGAPLSLVAPLREMSMMVGALLGMLVLHERVGVWRLVGCAVLVGGVVLLSSS